MNSGNFISGVLLGAITGLTIGLLFAPDKGTETRKKILEKGNDLKEGLKNKMSGYADEGEKILAETNEKAQNWIKKAKTNAENVIDEGKEKVESMEANTFNNAASTNV